MLILFFIVHIFILEMFVSILVFTRCLLVNLTFSTWREINEILKYFYLHWSQQIIIKKKKYDIGPYIAKHYKYLEVHYIIILIICKQMHVNIIVFVRIWTMYFALVYHKTLYKKKKQKHCTVIKQYFKLKLVNK